MRCPRCLYHGTMLGRHGEEACINCGFEPTEQMPDDIARSLAEDHRWGKIREPKPERIRKLKADTRRATDALIRRHVERLREDD